MRGTPVFAHLVVPGPLDQRTGGYLYDARIVEELGLLGSEIAVHSVSGRFPDVDDEARSSLEAVLSAIADGETVVLDGLAMGGAPDVVRRHAPRLALLSLVHHPLADETGQTPEQVERLRESECAGLATVRGVLVTSPFTAGRLADFDVPEARIRVIEPGTEPAPLATGPGDDAPPRLICVASVTPRKGHDVLVAALAQVPDLAWHCVCAGSTTRDPAFADAVRHAVREAGLEERIDFVGELAADALEEVYAGASLFVLPSHYEGYGMAFAEAVARGLPVLGTTGGAIPHTVPAAAGVLVAPGDADALAGALRDLLEAPSRLETLAEGARSYADRLPGWSEQARAFGRAVTELVALG